MRDASSIKLAHWLTGRRIIPVVSRPSPARVRTGHGWRVVARLPRHCLLRLQLQDISLSLTAFDRRPSPCQPRTRRRHTLLHGVHGVAERCSVDRCYVCRTSGKRKFKSVMPDYVIRCFQLAHKGGFSAY